MQQQKEQITRSTISYRNKRAKEQIQHILQLAERIASDVEKEKRESMHLCLCCYYARSQRIGGAAITSKPCGVCEETMQFGSTATDAVCDSCAKEQGLCKQCGADIELAERRKPYPFENEINKKEISNDQ